MKIKLFEPYINDQARANVLRVLSGTQIAQGPEVDLFEKEFAEKFGFEPWQIVTLNSGTAALELAYEISGIENGDEVITPVLTCTATNIPLVRRKAKIIFGDIDGHKSLNISPSDIAKKITDKTKAVVFVHFGGCSEGLKSIESLTQSCGVDLICDAAQALGSTISKVARFSTISLQAIKSLTAGDGGILVCRDEKDAILARKLRWFGYDRVLKQALGDIDLEVAGYKMHMNDISAAIARGNMTDWWKILSHRMTINEIYARYAYPGSLIQGIWNPQVINMFYSSVAERTENAGFEVGKYHYRNDEYSIFKDAVSDCPMMNTMENEYFLLPCHLGMTLGDAEHIAMTIWPQA